jgi:hypothetical protein
MLFSSRCDAQPLLEGAAAASADECALRYTRRAGESTEEL